MLSSHVPRAAFQQGVPACAFCSQSFSDESCLLSTQASCSLLSLSAMPSIAPYVYYLFDNQAQHSCVNWKPTTWVMVLVAHGACKHRSTWGCMEKTQKKPSCDALHEMGGTFPLPKCLLPNCSLWLPLASVPKPNYPLPKMYIQPCLHSKPHLTFYILPDLKIVDWKVWRKQTSQFISGHPMDPSKGPFHFTVWQLSNCKPKLGWRSHRVIWALSALTHQNFKKSIHRCLAESDHSCPMLKGPWTVVREHVSNLLKC